MASRVEKLEQEVKSLKQQLARGNRSMLVSISSLAPAAYSLKREVSILIIPDEDSYIASLIDANVNASGETVPEAVANLKDMMIMLFERLGAEPKGKLGKWPARQLGVLRELMRKKVRHAADH